MEILFCDLCNESVPLSDLRAGRAYRSGERVVCSACDQAMGGGARSRGAATATANPRAETRTRPAPPVDEDGAVPAPGGGGGVLLGLVALLVAAGGLAVVGDRQQQLEDRQAREATGLDLRLGAIEARMAGLAERLPAALEASEERILRQAEARATSLSESITRLEGAITATRLERENLSAELAGLRTTMGDRDRSSRLELVRLNERLGSLDERLRGLEARTIAVEESQRIVGVASASLGGGEARAPRPDQATDRAPSWQGLLADLDHESPGIRLEALYALGATRDPATVPHILSMLDDEDIFVQMTAIGILAEDFRAREAVPRFIDALEHENSAVRETAMIALRDLTGREFRFDPSGSPADRSKRVEAWRDWWERNGEEFLGDR